MGDPKKQEKHYDSVRRPWDKDRITQEEKIVQKYGLRKKKELRKAETILRRLRQRARSLIGTKNEKDQTLLLRKAYELGLTEKDATLDHILNLKVDTVLDRRIQTMLIKTSLANTPLQARQFITHGHISIGGIKVISPSYIVRRSEEKAIGFLQASVLNGKFKLNEKKETSEKNAKKTYTQKDTVKKEEAPKTEKVEEKKEAPKEKPKDKASDEKKHVKKGE